jgi:antitoxin VapB
MYNLVMPLHINNPEVEREIRSLAADTGESLTEAIGIAVRERRRRLQPRIEDRATYEKIMRIANRVAALPVLDDRSADEILGYDENGLPS